MTRRLTDYYVDPLASEKRRGLRDSFVAGCALGVYLAAVVWSAEIGKPPQDPPKPGIPLYSPPPHRDPPPPVNDCEPEPT